MVEISTYQIRACSFTAFFFGRKSAAENKNPDLIGRGFNHLREERGWLKLEPIRLEIFFSYAYFRSKNEMLRHSLRTHPRFAGKKLRARSSHEYDVTLRGRPIRCVFMC